MHASFELDAYLERIGYTGPRTPTLNTLRALHLLHPQAIPFENLDPILRRPIRLDVGSLEEKLVRGGRGGYCYEHNLLWMHALQAVGFQVTGLAARVLWNAPPGLVRPRTHMLLKIDLAGEAWVADVGFGGQTLTAPLRLITDAEQPTPHGSFRLVRDGDDFVLESRVRSEWKPVYRFDLQPQSQPDYEVTSWYLSNHPESLFLNTLLVARVAQDGRYGLMNNRLSIHHLQGDSEQRLLTSAGEIRAVLESTFGVRLPEDPGLEAALARFVQREVSP